MAESAFLKNFNFIGYAYGEASYLATTFITAVETMFREHVKEDPYKASLAQNIIKSVIHTNKVEIMGKKYQERSQSMRRTSKINN